MNDDVLLEVIESSGYYDFKKENVDDLPAEKRAIVILVDELFAMRPELNKNESDVVYVKKIILENGTTTYDLPTKSITNYLKEPPFVDSSIWTYSVKDCKLLKRLYQGTGIKWERVK